MLMMVERNEVNCQDQNNTSNLSQSLELAYVMSASRALGLWTGRGDKQYHPSDTVDAMQMHFRIAQEPWMKMSL